MTTAWPSAWTEADALERLAAAARWSRDHFVWTGSLSREGLPVVKSHGGMQVRMQHVACQLEHGESPNARNRRIRPLCGERLCVRPDHFAWWPDRVGPRKRSPEHLRAQRIRGYGISVAEHDTMYEVQGGRCDICAESFSDTPCIDHCHATGEVRALLCRSCNTAAAMVRDNPGIARALGDYLEHHERRLSLSTTPPPARRRRHPLQPPLPHEYGYAT